MVRGALSRENCVMVNGKELARNRYGMNVVVFNSLSGKSENFLCQFQA